MPAPTPLDLSTWLPAHVATQSRGALLRVVVPDSPAPVAVDPERFGQVLDIIIDNAFRYGTPGTPVIVTVARRGSDIVLTVENEGQNIPEADRGRVFAQPGRGLTAAAEIVRSFGCKIVALPHRTGARIAILLPAAGG